MEPRWAPFSLAPIGHKPTGDKWKAEHESRTRTWVTLFAKQPHRSDRWLDMSLTAKLARVFIQVDCLSLAESGSGHLHRRDRWSLVLESLGL